MTVLLAAAVAIFALLFPSAISSESVPTTAEFAPDDAAPVDAAPVDAAPVDAGGVSVALDPRSAEGALLETLLGEWVLTLADSSDGTPDLRFRIDWVPDSSLRSGPSGTVSAQLMLGIGDRVSAPLTLARHGDGLCVASTLQRGQDDVQLSASLVGGTLRGSFYDGDRGELSPWSARRV